MTKLYYSSEDLCVLKATRGTCVPPRLDMNLGLQEQAAQILPMKIKTYIERTHKWRGQDKDRIIKGRQSFKK